MNALQKIKTLTQITSTNSKISGIMTRTQVLQQEATKLPINKIIKNIKTINPSLFTSKSKSSSSSQQQQQQQQQQNYIKIEDANFNVGLSKVLTEYLNNKSIKIDDIFSKYYNITKFDWTQRGFYPSNYFYYIDNTKQQSTQTNYNIYIHHFITTFITNYGININSNVIRLNKIFKNISFEILKNENNLQNTIKDQNKIYIFKSQNNYNFYYIRQTSSTSSIQIDNTFLLNSLIYINNSNNNLKNQLKLQQNNLLTPNDLLNVLYILVTKLNKNYTVPSGTNIINFKTQFFEPLLQFMNSRNVQNVNKIELNVIKDSWRSYIDQITDDTNLTDDNKYLYKKYWIDIIYIICIVFKCGTLSS